MDPHAVPAGGTATLLKTSGSTTDAARALALNCPRLLTKTTVEPREPPRFCNW